MMRLWILLLLLPNIALAGDPDDTAQRALDFFAQGRTDEMVDFFFRQGTLAEASEAPVTEEVLKLKMELQKFRENGGYCFREKVLHQEISRRLVRQVWLVGFVGGFNRVEFWLYRPAERWVFAHTAVSDGDSANSLLLADLAQPDYRPSPETDAAGPGDGASLLPTCGLHP